MLSVEARLSSLRQAPVDGGNHVSFEMNLCNCCFAGQEALLSCKGSGYTQVGIRALAELCDLKRERFVVGSRGEAVRLQHNMRIAARYIDEILTRIHHFLTFAASAALF